MIRYGDRIVERNSFSFFGCFGIRRRGVDDLGIL